MVLPNGSSPRPLEVTCRGTDPELTLVEAAVKPVAMAMATVVVMMIRLEVIALPELVLLSAYAP